MSSEKTVHAVKGFIQILVAACALIFFAHACDVAHAAQEINYDEEYVNQPKFKDCQMLMFDESFLGKRYKRKQEVLVCRWEVQIGGDTLIFWKEPGTSRYGFTR